jgi:hypothetical protein
MPVPEIAPEPTLSVAEAFAKGQRQRAISMSEFPVRNK